MNQAITVSQLNRYLKNCLAADENLRSLTVKGELSNFTNHQKTGQFYFTLKDVSASVKAVMFRQNASRVRFNPENGMNVILTGSVQVFERDGVYQLYCESMEPDGIGALALAFEQLKEKLAKEGLFDPAHKRPLPPLPKTIGVVTAKTGAALQDIVNILSRRYPLARLVVIPALVQGENAPASIIEGIRAAEEAGGIDVLIVGRGGGSMEDLWCFNDEGVARAIYHCSIPIISAVGHEIDFTIADFAADVRAPTPSAAAELCAPSAAELESRLAGSLLRLEGQIRQLLRQHYERLKADYGRLQTASPMNRVGQSERLLNEREVRLHLAAGRLFREKEERLFRLAAVLESVSPLKVLTRGYSVTRGEQGILRSVSEAVPGSLLTTRLPDGLLESRVERVLPAEENAIQQKG